MWNHGYWSPEYWHLGYWGEVASAAPTGRDHVRVRHVLKMGGHIRSAEWLVVRE